jgi:hypothetical protein
LGQKYGLRPLPTAIDSEEFEILKSQLQTLQSNAFSVSCTYEKDSPEPIEYKIENVLDQCYKIDTNSVPAMYRLMRISEIIPDYVSNEMKRQEYSRHFWDLVQSKVSNLLRKAADLAFENNLIDEIKRERYFISSNLHFIHSHSRLWILIESF